MFLWFKLFTSLVNEFSDDFRNFMAIAHSINFLFLDYIFKNNYITYTSNFPTT